VLAEELEQEPPEVFDLGVFEFLMMTFVVFGQTKVTT